ncbi:MAG: signal peptidase I [Pikeienuella sp.]
MTDADPSRRKWWIALLMAVGPGAGWLYLGRPRIFWALFAAFALILAVPYPGWSAIATPRGVMALGLATIIILALACLGPVISGLFRGGRMPGWPRRRISYLLGGALWWACAAAPAVLGLQPSLQTFSIASGSMEPALRAGDKIVADGSAERLAALREGDMIAFHVPGDDMAVFIKRIVAGPGAKARLVNGAPEINGALLEQERIGEIEAAKGGMERAMLTLLREQATSGRRYEVTRNDLIAPRWTTVEEVMGQDEYYVLGDNRENSRDSRERPPMGLGPVRRENVIGVATGVYWSSDPARIGLRLD